MSYNATALQTKLESLGYDVGPDGVDGVFGSDTQKALRKFQSDQAIPPTGQPDQRTIALLFPKAKPAKGLNIVEVKIADYFLNFITSKINWAAAAMVGIVVAWLNTKFGLQVPADVQAWVTGIIVTGFGLIIMYLRTFLNAPKVAMKQPDVVKNS